MKASDYLTVREVAQELRISHSSVLTLIHKGMLPATDVSSNPRGRARYIVLQQDLQAFLLSRKVASPAAPLKQRRRTPPSVQEWIK